MKTFKCRVCGKPLETVLRLGKIQPFTFGTTPKPLPLELGECTACGLVQLTEEIEMDTAYRQYWYRSGLNPSMLDSLKNIVEDIESRDILQPNDVVIDIGCNDGSLFNYYETPVYKVGFDPAYNLKQRAEKNCDEFVNDYFKANSKKAKVITSIAMFYDLPDPPGFVENVKNSLEKGGVWVIQFTDLLSMFQALAYDNICFEHLEYYTLKTVYQLLNTFDMDIFDVSYNSVNGGSIRILVGHVGEHKIQPCVRHALRNEANYFNYYDFDWFSNRSNLENSFTYYYVKNLVLQGKEVHLLGASTKGITLIQTIFPPEAIKEFITCVAEINEDKYGLDFLGLPILPEEASFSLKPDAYLVLPWHFEENLIKKLAHFEGELIFPLPEFHVVKR